MPTPTVEVQVLETRVDLSNDMTWRQMIGVGVRNVVLARGMLDKLEGPKYAERRAELRRKAREAARARDRQTTAASQNEAEESDESCPQGARVADAVPLTNLQYTPTRANSQNPNTVHESGDVGRASHQRCQDS